MSLFKIAQFEEKQQAAEKEKLEFEKLRLTANKKQEQLLKDVYQFHEGNFLSHEPIMKSK
ncbi:CLUMA_CG010084, isoform A [Clunio marinus]|uniref:CLUMA_CG010084, isoform A n=1 Tax=Clunio marinus TaxID=568069 RepID=A0A1J1I895_9DIPT|nr:CLUMA_CG010084, isoform A [Clunio marinus]